MLRGEILLLSAAAEWEAVGRWRQTPSIVYGILIRNWSEGISVMEEEKHFQCDGGQMLEQGNKSL